MFVIPRGKYFCVILNGIIIKFVVYLLLLCNRFKNFKHFCHVSGVWNMLHIGVILKFIHLKTARRYDSQNMVIIIMTQMICFITKFNFHSDKMKQEEVIFPFTSSLCLNKVALSMRLPTGGKKKKETGNDQAESPKKSLLFPIYYVMWVFPPTSTTNAGFRKTMQVMVKGTVQLEYQNLSLFPTQNCKTLLVFYCRIYT